MFRRLKKRLKEWVEDLQRREIARLRQEAIQLKEEIERETGRPIEFDLPPVTVPVVKLLFAAPLGQPLHFVEA